MPDTADRWMRWLTKDRHGGHPDAHRAALMQLAPIRDRVLLGARLEGDETVLDLGCGEGLISFAALERVPAGKVIFSDLSNQLIERCREIADRMKVLSQCEFVTASADDLGVLDDASVDVITARSVLIYLDREGKLRALDEAFRILRPKGRLSIFEPINRFSFPEPPGQLLGYDVRAVGSIAAKVKAAMESDAEARL
jgi:arsenite methyltransferase